MSQPWPDALEALTGSKQMDATAILDYFAPLQDVAGRTAQGQAGRVVARQAQHRSLSSYTGSS